MKPIYISRRAAGAATVWMASDWLQRWNATDSGITIGVDNFLHPWAVDERGLDRRLWWELRVTPGLAAAVCDLIRARHRWSPTIIPSEEPNPPRAA